MAWPILPVDSERFSEGFLPRFMRSRIHLRISVFVTHRAALSNHATRGLPSSATRQQRSRPGMCLETSRTFRQRSLCYDFLFCPAPCAHLIGLIFSLF